MRFLLNWLVNSIAIAVAAALVPGIAPFGADPWVAYAIAGLFLGIVNGTMPSGTVTHALTASSAMQTPQRATWRLDMGAPSRLDAVLGSIFAETE